MYSKTMLYGMIDRERDYLETHEVGTEEYNASLQRLKGLNEQLKEIEQFEVDFEAKEKESNDTKKDRFIKNAIEVGKFVVGGVVIPLVGLVCITATEKESTFTGALKEYTRLFIPKKM